MDIVVVLEPDTPTNIRLLGPDHAPAHPEVPVRRAHTAPTEASGACGPRTLCGLDTSDMTLAPHRADHPDRFRLHWHTCSACRYAGAAVAPDTPEDRPADTRPGEGPAF
ncbi:hypothetical protein [Kitasatospora purpeofusca]|uniref:hypothetical protein n=1 Tax=Kitasatospora purpeofusca TaxID=67352 RepID=UPI0036D381EB